MAIESVYIPYPDFQLNEVIDPEQFDANNGYLVDKLNVIVSLLNQITDSSESGSGASLIDVSAIAPFASSKLQTFLQGVVARLQSIESTKSGSDFIGSSVITGVQGNTVQSQLQSLQANINKLKSDVQLVLNEKADKGNTYTVSQIDTLLMQKANRSEVYTKTELDPYLRGGDTTVRYDVFTIVSGNNGDGTFTYQAKGGKEVLGQLTEEGYQIFTLQNGTYAPGTNQIKMIVGDTLHRSVASGGLLEIDDVNVALTIPESAGREITIEYFERVGVSGEASVVISKTVPTRLSATIWFKDVTPNYMPGVF